MNTCPRCKGEKQNFVFENRGADYRTHTGGYRDCALCGATGSVSDERMKLIEDGKMMRRERIANGVSLIEAAERFGISVAQLSAIENGTVA